MNVYILSALHHQKGKVFSASSNEEGRGGGESNGEFHSDRLQSSDNNTRCRPNIDLIYLLLIDKKKDSLKIIF